MEELRKRADVKNLRDQGIISHYNNCEHIEIYILNDTKEHDPQWKDARIGERQAKKGEKMEAD